VLLRPVREKGRGEGSGGWGWLGLPFDPPRPAPAAGGSVTDAAELVGIRPGTIKRHLAALRARSGLTTEQLIYAGRASGRLVVPSLGPH
jgi:hypothetical protein